MKKRLISKIDFKIDSNLVFYRLERPDEDEPEDRLDPDDRELPLLERPRYEPLELLPLDRPE